MSTFLLTLMFGGAVWLYLRSELKLRQARAVKKPNTKKAGIKYTKENTEAILKSIPDAPEAHEQVSDEFASALGAVAEAVAGGRSSVSLEAWKFKNPWTQTINVDLFLQLKAVLEPKGYVLELYRDGLAILIQHSVNIKISW